MRIRWIAVSGGWELIRDGKVVGGVQVQFTEEGIAGFIWWAVDADGGEHMGGAQTPEEAKRFVESVSEP